MEVLYNPNYFACSLTKGLARSHEVLSVELVNYRCCCISGIDKAPLAGLWVYCVKMKEESESKLVSCLLHSRIAILTPVVPPAVAVLEI